MPHTKKAEMSLSSLEVLLREAATEGALEYQSVLRRVLSSAPGTEKYRSLLCDLNVAASWMEIKAKTAQEAIDEYLDSLPDDED